MIEIWHHALVVVVFILTQSVSESEAIIDDAANSTNAQTGDSGKSP